MNDFEGKNLPETRAVIDIGSTSIRMVIAEIKIDGIRQIETLSKDTNLGRDTFKKGMISIETAESCVSVLRGFKRVLAEYGIDSPERIKAVATSAVREARNSETFVDRIYMAVGIKVDVIDGADVNRLTFFGLQKSFSEEPFLSNNKVLVVEVGGGSLELIGMDSGRVSFSQTYRLGAFRLRERVENISAGPEETLEMYEAEILKTVRQIHEYVGRASNQKLLALGGDARFAASMLNKNWDGESISSVNLSRLNKLVESVINQSEESLVQKYNMSFADAETLAPALKILACLAGELHIRSILVGTSTLRDGLLYELANGGAWTRSFMEQVEYSVRRVGEKYGYTREHADFVKDISLRLFKEMKFEHKLSRHYEGILVVASLLHDIGKYISNRSHHKHSQYLIENSDIFGLSDRDTSIAALVARYHRRSLPKASHDKYVSLDKDTRLTVKKLGSILRVADALDYSRQFKAEDICIERTDSELLFKISTNRDIAAEKVVVKEKSEWFERVYGHKVKFVAC
ncbi:HD domain-containing protein [Sedimentisphaera salicampi]|uniref:Exopolyphosphatase n=1 Tax=Sedimentisphaera salicampi TaxID=1941349 RepID=A0A1W6LM88_9BACT|nr:HD domain-containing protein [Sedimentisphaera salicampi]ARN56853.1 Exopolyphosphatase [Sedimentisphaera salicampi]OXU15022.1 Exopolyphosphatase [Sedimentisphaera salicampi]